MIKEDVIRNLSKIRALLTKKSKVLNLTHSHCMDGAGTQIVLSNCIENVDFRKVSYYNINSVLEKIDYSNYDCVLITDISPEKIEPENINEKIILLDHHATALKYHDPDKLRFVYDGEAATKLVKQWCEIVFDEDLSHLDYLVTLINDYDIWIHNDPKSKRLKMLYYHLGDIKFRQRFHLGGIEWTEKDLAFFKREDDKFNKLYDELEIFELESINGCFIYINDFLNEIAEKLMDEEDFKLVLIKTDKTTSISVRSRIENCHIGETLQELNLGGGHSGAGGGLVSNNSSELKEKIKLLESTLYQKYDSIRKGN